MADARERVLIVDDDPGFREAWRLLLEQDGFPVAEAGTADDGFARLTETVARLVVLDLMLPPSGRADAGAALCRRIVAHRPDTKVIVVSGAGEISLALGLLRDGAYDFLAKPVDPDVLLAVVHRAAARLVLEDHVRELETRLGARDDTSVLGGSPAIVAARTLCERLAPTDVPVLLTGESGTGKEVFARMLHAHSRRGECPLIAVNCGALSAPLLRHEMQRALVMAAGRHEILVEDLSPGVRRAGLATTPPVTGDAAELTTLEAKITQLERSELVAAMAATGGNKAQAAQRLGLSRQGLLNKLARHGIG